MNTHFRDPAGQVGLLDAGQRLDHLVRIERFRLLTQPRDFVTETVFSHPSKLELIDEARIRGFTVIVMHVGVDTPDLSVARVGTRVEEGGHIVPEDKIRARYARGAPFIRAAVLKAESGHGL